MIETFQVERVILFNNPAISLKMFVCLQGQKMDVWQDDNRIRFVRAVFERWVNLGSPARAPRV